MTERDAAWTFAEAFYSRSGVSNTLIRLQDDHRVDIPLLLVVLHAARCGLMLDPIAMRELSDQAGSWQHGVVAPIRKARRALKNCSLDLDGGLYKQAKALEIGAEKAIILKLGAMFPVGLQVSADIAALANLEVYRRLLDSTENLFASVLTDFGNYQAEMPQ